MMELRKFLNEKGQVTLSPTSPKEVALVVDYLAGKFSSDKRYSELEVNAILKQWHTFSDWVTLRRELVDRGFLDRELNGSVYWRTALNPQHREENFIPSATRSTKQLFKVEGVGVRALDYEDVSLIEGFYKHSTDFFVLVTGEAPTRETATGLFESLPPHQPKDEAVYIGLFRDTLVGIVKLDRDYPAEGEWFVSLFLIAAALRNKGLGHKVMHGLEAWLKEQGVKRLSLVVIEENQAALRFWEREGFTQTRVLPPKTLGEKTHVLLECAKDLQGE
jgi:RimJ/RimL family protein N-acetyltransferase